MRQKRFWMVGLVLALASLHLGPIPVAHAATITVNTTDDEFNTDGDCSLREAILAANTNSVVDGCTGGWLADTITLPAGTYALTILGADEEASATGDLDITGDLTINGAGAGITIIQAGTNSTNGIDRVLDVHAGVTVEINDVAIFFGRTPDIDDERDGGGIRNEGTLTLNNSLVWFNTAGYGGGIYNLTGTLTLDNCTVRYNDADWLGGGIRNYVGTLTLDNCTVSDNDADLHGGGIYNWIGALMLNNSTVYHNSADYGGGIYNSGTLTLDNCTVSDNGADGYGGGIRNYGTLTLDNSTIAHNTADKDNDGSGDGGGVAVQTDATAHVMNTIIGDNQDRSGEAPDCSGTLTSQGYNLLENTAGCTFIPTAGDVTGADPNLGALVNNGGSTYTHALLTGSPAIERIPDGTNGCQAGVSTDQRGYVRAGGPGSGGSSCDIGAYEYDTVLAPPTGPVYLPIIMRNN